MDKPFNIHWYDYESAKDSYIEYLVCSLIEAWRLETALEVVKAEKAFGGKALGLALADSLTKYHYPWQTPYWFGIPEEFYHSGAVPEEWLLEKTTGRSPYEWWVV